MKHYQDTITGQIYAFEEYQNIDTIMKENRNIPKTLTSAVKEKPSDDHIWHQGKWIHKKDKPKNYEEPLSEIPSYDPAWIAFLFEPLVIISDNEKDFILTLDDVNTNLYDSRILSKFVAKFKDNDSKTKLDVLITYDGSIMLPIDENYNTPEKAVDKFNKIIGALFLGGILAKPIDMTNLCQGCIVENGGSNFLYNLSPNNAFRNKSVNITERIKALHPCRIKTKDIIEVYEFGVRVMKEIDFSPIFLNLGYQYLNQGKIAEALSNLWIVIEQLTDFLYKNKIDESIVKILKRALSKNVEISIKHNILHEVKIINEQIYQSLSKNRIARNKLLHEGKIPNKDDVVELWRALLKLLEVATGEEFNNLQKISNSNLESNITAYAKNITPANTNFDQWENESLNT